MLTVIRVWEPGKKLHGGRYTIQKKLGEGGFGITFVAQNNKGQLVVIKTLRDHILSKPKDAKSRHKLLQDFKEEALRLAVCRHPHIVEIENVFHEDSLPCIAMEYIPGMNLEEWNVCWNCSRSLSKIRAILKRRRWERCFMYLPKQRQTSDELLDGDFSDAQYELVENDLFTGWNSL